MEEKRQLDKWLTFSKLFMQALKIGVGSSLAIFVATFLHLNYASSAGIITLLTILSTRWETLKLSGYRIFTFLISIGLIYLLTIVVPENYVWIEFGVFMLLIVLISERFGWKATISVNAVVGTHLIVSRDVSLESIWNELLLVLLGITIAIVVNAIQHDKYHEQTIGTDICFIEDKMRAFLKELVCYLRQESLDHSVWDDIISLESHVEKSMERAVDFQNNVFHNHSNYYVLYFETREKQLTILHNLHYEMRKIRMIPEQANVVADYIAYLQNHLGDKTKPEGHLKQLHHVLEELAEEELPKTREEFENRAMLYHILMDLEEFVVLKRRFVEELSEEQRTIYLKED